MEDSRKGKRSGKKKDFQHLTHTWMEEMVKKAIVYNTKREGKNEGGKKKRTTTKGKNLVLSVLVLGHVRRYFLYVYANNFFFSIR